ncbi:MAG: hypothetical protein U0X73_02640 [Thermoanaerobaculia bacterium]
MRAPGTDLPGLDRSDRLDFLNDPALSAVEFRRMLHEGPPEKRAWAVSQLIQFAEWDEIWQYVSRDEVRDLLPQLELPENLRLAWARILKSEAAR